MSVLVPENGTRVFCRLPDYNGKMFWFERKVLGNTEGSMDYPGGMILVDSSEQSHCIIPTGSFLRADSVDGQEIEKNRDYVPMDTDYDPIDG